MVADREDQAVTDWKDATHAIAVQLDYYDKTHHEALNKYSTAIKIQELINAGIVTIPLPEFLTYFLFHRIRATSRYAGFASVRSDIVRAEAMLSDFVEPDGGELHIASDALKLPNYVTENIGESVALSVMNRIHGLTEADWTPIPESTRKKTLDYQLGSDGVNLIQVEAKGSVAETTDVKSASVSNHKADIEKKKKANPAKSPTDLKYGVITVIPQVPGTIKAWLLDPVPEGFERSPRDLRLIARMEFLRWIIWLVSPRSHLATALATRVTELNALREPYELSGVSLTQANGRPFEVTSGIKAQDYAPFFATRSRVADGPAGGIVFPAESKDALLFVGFRTELLEFACDQRFDRIIEYSGGNASTVKNVLCTVPAAEFDSFRIDPERVTGFNQTGGYVHFELRGLLRYSQEGLVFGVLPLKKAA
jgi:hypothetical protein